MVKPLFSHGGFDLVPMQKRHIVPFLNDMAAYNIAEYQDESDNLLSILIDMQKHEDCFVVEKNGSPIQIVGVQAIGNQQSQMWSMFTNEMERSWIGVVKFSPRIISYIHQTYYEIHLSVNAEDLGVIKWMIWLGFSISSTVDDESGDTYVQFVRCNPDRKNVYALSSRPVMH